LGLEALDRSIPGTTKLHRLEENVGTAEVQLSANDLRTIADTLAEIEIHGDRYPAHLQASINR
jgi:aryl-alcohol dehydrogenase-like predicted oxidoreductase